MLLQKKIQISKLENDRSVVERIVDENIAGKLDAYLRKFKEGTECALEIRISGNKKGNFCGSIQLDADGTKYRSERDDYKKLDDLINHLFDHIKEQLSKKRKGRFSAFIGRIFSKEAA
jgi:hypothetical protein